MGIGSLTTCFAFSVRSDRQHNQREEDAMGSPVGVFSNEEVKGLTAADIQLLKAHVIHHIQTSPEIRRILHADRKLLRKLTTDKRINKILRKEAAAMKKRLERKK
jgi:hypothetical protein